jgi:hypothetical protein
VGQIHGVFLGISLLSFTLPLHKFDYVFFTHYTIDPDRF